MRKSNLKKLKPDKWTTRGSSRWAVAPAAVCSGPLWKSRAVC